MFRSGGVFHSYTDKNMPGISLSIPGVCCHVNRTRLREPRVSACCSVFQALRREGKNISVKEVMDGWTLQMGYPVVTISTSESPENTVTISQEHFLYDQDSEIHQRPLLNKRYRPV